MVLAILKLTLVSVVVAPDYFSVTVENVRYKFPLVNRLSAWNLIIVALGVNPHQFTITLHARVHKFSYVVSSIGPFELTLPLDPRVLHLTSVDVDFCDTMGAR